MKSIFKQSEWYQLIFLHIGQIPINSNYENILRYQNWHQNIDNHYFVLKLKIDSVLVKSTHINDDLGLMFKINPPTFKIISLSVKYSVIMRKTLFMLDFIAEN